MRPTDTLISNADKIIAGQGEAFQDWRDALELYQAAAKLESGKAFSRLAEIYSNDRYGKINIEKAIYNHKQAIRLSYGRSSALLAQLYDSIDDKANSTRLWNYFLLNFDETDGEDRLILLFNCFCHLFDSNEPFKINKNIDNLLDGLVDFIKLFNGEALNRFLEEIRGLEQEYSKESLDNRLKIMNRIELLNGLVSFTRNRSNDMLNYLGLGLGLFLSELNEEIEVLRDKIN